MTRRGAAALAIALVLAGCGGNAGGGTSPDAGSRDAGGGDGARLAVIGDSLAFGRFADTQADAFPQRVAATMRARLELLAAPGVTTAQLAGQPTPGGADAVVLEAGTNDFLFQTPRDRFAGDYRALVAKAKAASPGAKLVCLTTWTPSDLPRAKIPASFYDATIRRECAGGAVASLAPISARPRTRGPEGRPTYLGPGDAFHPNSAGHAAIARAIEAEL
jgi:lysophospholipase L1-like esterase